MRHLDRAAGEINPFLMVLAIGVVILYLTCIAALVATVHFTQMSPAGATPTAHGAADAR